MINVTLSSERQVKASSQEKVQGVVAPPVVEGWKAALSALEHGQPKVGEVAGTQWHCPMSLV